MLKLVLKQDGTEVESMCVCVRVQNQRGVLQENHRLLSHSALIYQVFSVVGLLLKAGDWFAQPRGTHTGRSAAISSVLHHYWHAIKTQSFIFPPT